MDQRLMVYHAKVNLIYRKLREKKEGRIKNQTKYRERYLSQGFLKEPKDSFKSFKSTTVESGKYNTVPQLKG